MTIGGPMPHPHPQIILFIFFFKCVIFLILYFYVFHPIMKDKLLFMIEIYKYIRIIDSYFLNTIYKYLLIIYNIFVKLFLTQKNKFGSAASKLP